MDTATVAVLVSGVVGVAGVTSPLILDRRAEARIRAERREARLDELREIIDCATEAVSRVMLTFPFLNPSSSDGVPQLARENLRAQLPSLLAALLGLWEVEHRVGTRVGWDDPLRHAVRELHDALGQIHVVLDDVAAGKPPREDVAKIMDRQAVALVRFYDESARRIGVERIPSAS